jgi:hypothetical protein
LLFFSSFSGHTAIFLFFLSLSCLFQAPTVSLAELLSGFEGMQRAMEQMNGVLETLNRRLEALEALPKPK